MSEREAKNGLAPKHHNGYGSIGNASAGSAIVLHRCHDPPVQVARHPCNLQQELQIKASSLEMALTKRLATFEPTPGHQDGASGAHGGLDLDDDIDDDDDDDMDDDIDLDPVQFQPRHDCQWLRARGPCMPLDTILGIPEDSRGARHTEASSTATLDPMLRIEWFTATEHGANSITGSTNASNGAETNAQDAANGPAHNCPLPRTEWRRDVHGKQVQRNGAGGTQAIDTTSANHYHVRWVDVRRGTHAHNNNNSNATPQCGTSQSEDEAKSLNDQEPLLSSKASALHFFRSLLGCTHDVSPWVPPTNEAPITSSQQPLSDQLPTACVLAVSPEQCNDMLTSFRISDASPSWFLHCVADLEELEDLREIEGFQLVNPHGSTSPNAAAAGTKSAAHPHNGNDQEATLLIFKPIFERPYLSTTHPKDSTVPVDPAGCLWETICVENTDNGSNGNSSGVNGNSNDQQSESKPSFSIEHRLVCPPILDFHQYYGDCGDLFSTENLRLFTEEAVNIPKWTPWPETQHYSSSAPSAAAGSGSASDSIEAWTVFPLCYCFPANDVDHRQWVPVTRSLCPQTCRILESVLGDRLRTALFSQLQPNTVLEAHSGWADLANHVVRLHIPLVVPEEEAGLCGLWVDGCMDIHRQGVPMVFDDSKIHRAFNYSDSSSRIVLIVDLERPPSLPIGRSTGGHSDELDKFIARMSGF